MRPLARPATRMGAFALALAAVSLSAVALCAAPALAERRVALVIGNGSYPTAPLKNPVNDARDMAGALRELGFEVILRENAGLRQMEDALDQFWTSLKKGGTGLFFFAGHGLQVKGVNYLVPVDARISVEQDVKSLCLDANRVLGRMEDAGNGLNIVLLDACRNNPFARSWRSADAGLAKMDAPTGTIIGYATAPDSVAADGAGRNGVYTQHLLREMRVPGQTIENALKRVRIAVLTDTGKKQTPWESSSLTGDFFFRPGAGAAPAVPSPPAAARPAKGRLDLSDIDTGAEARAKAEAAQKDWAARLAQMQEDFARVQALEQNPKYASAERAKAWEKFQAAYADKNPHSDEDRALRDKAKAQQGYWESTARREQAETALAVQERSRYEQLQKIGAAPASAAPVMPAGPPDTAFFQGTLWRSNRPSGSNPPFSIVRFDAGGRMAYSYTTPEAAKQDGTDFWRVEGGRLILTWTNGYATETFDVPLRADQYQGRHTVAGATTLVRIR